MKRLLIFTITMFIAMSISLSKAHSADFNVGLYSFYSVWDPAWKNINKNDYDNEPLLLWGPFFSVDFLDRWSISAVIVQNLTNNSNATYTVDGNGTSGPYQAKLESSLARADLDLTLSYKLFNPMKIFAGLKYFAYEEAAEKVSISNTLYTINDDEFTDSYRTGGVSSGPAVGFSLTFPIAEKLFISFGTSILYMNFELTMSEIIEQPSGTLSSYDKLKYTYKITGNNSTLNLSYYIESWSMSVALGGRFQVLKYNAESDAPDLDNDYFYGTTFAVLFHL